MIKLLLNTRVRRSALKHTRPWVVEALDSGAILAYCDAREEAETLQTVLSDLLPRQIQRLGVEIEEGSPPIL